MHEALSLVRRELGPDAAVLHARQVRQRWLGVLPGRRQIEVTAAQGVNVPSRFHKKAAAKRPVAALPGLPAPPSPPAAVDDARISHQVHSQLSTLQAMMKDLCRRSKGDGPGDRPDELFHLFTELLDAEVVEEVARDLVERLRCDPRAEGLTDPVMLKARAAGIIEDGVRVTGPIRVTPGRCRLAALVGPTGVGKTTTIAKLAANYRLKEKRRVGLITVDTYRIAAVEQLRTYADIIDLPMHVVSTPREMRETVERMRQPGSDPAGHRRPQSQGRGPHPGTESLPQRGRRRRGPSGPQQRFGRADPGANRRAVQRGRRHRRCC